MSKATITVALNDVRKYLPMFRTSLYRYILSGNVSNLFDSESLIHAVLIVHFVVVIDIADHHIVAFF
jgi:hypothetical protein